MNEDKKEIKKLKYKIEVLEQRIQGLEKDLDYVVENSPDLGMIRYCIEELQEEVAKMQNKGTGMLFTPFQHRIKR
tara:strand:- start:458 stop:682 length:225 start_codon:yes stop_codon:yes gene_type:complete